MAVQVIHQELTVGEGVRYRNEKPDSCISEISVKNNTPKEIWVCYRDGVIAAFPSTRDYYHSEAVTITYGKQMTTGGRMSVVHGHEDVNVGIIQRELNRNAGSFVGSEDVMLADILSNRDGIYIKNADICIYTTEEQAHRLNHPYCTQHAHNTALQAVEDFDPTKMVNIAVRLIDNTGTLGDQYFVCHDQVMKVSPQASPLVKDGLYVTGLTTMVNDSNGIREDICYTMKDIMNGDCPFVLYSTTVEANNARDADTNKLESEKIKAEQTRMRMENETLKADQDKERLEKAKELEELKNKLEREMLLIKAEAEKANNIAVMRTKELEDSLSRVRYERDSESVRYSRDMNREKATLHTQTSNQKAMVETIKTVAIFGALGTSLYSILK